MNRRATLWWSALLVSLVLATYLPSLRNGFIWDDDGHLTANPHALGTRSFAEIWTTPAANYFPLVLTLLRGLHGWFGLAAPVYHFTTLALHAAAALLLWRVLRALNIPAAWLGAAAWAVHPVQVESVAWISETKNTLSGVFFLAAVLVFLRWQGTARDGGRRFSGTYALALVCGGLALASKPSTVMLPCALALAWWWREGNLSWRKLIWLGPFLGLSLAVSAWTIWEQKFNSGAVGPPWHQTFAERLIIAGRVPWFYFAKALWPQPLVFNYPRWTLSAAQWSAYLPLLAAAIAVGAAVWARRARGWWLAVGYFGAMLFPVLGFFDVYYFRYSFVADHFQYLAGMAPIAGGVGAVARLLSLRRGPAAIGGALLLGPLALISARECRIYRDDETLFRTVLQRNPDSTLALNNLGKSAALRGETAVALTRFQSVLRLEPDHPEAHANLGALLLEQPGHEAEAREHLEAALRTNPRLPDAHAHLGLLLARNYGRREEGIAHLEYALRLKPDSAEAHVNLGFVLSDDPRQFALAREHYEQALRLRPQFALAHSNLADLLATSPAHLPEAIEHYDAALRARPDLPATHNNLANALAKIPGRLPEAFAHYEEALRQQPDFAAAHYNYANKLTPLPERQAEAIAHYERALQSSPDLFPAAAKLAALYLARGDRAAALRTLRTAAVRRPADEALRRQIAELEQPPAR